MLYADAYEVSACSRLAGDIADVAAAFPDPDVQLRLYPTDVATLVRRLRGRYHLEEIVDGWIREQYNDLPAFPCFKRVLPWEP